MRHVEALCLAIVGNSSGGGGVGVDVSDGGASQSHIATVGIAGWMSPRSLARRILSSYVMSGKMRTASTSDGSGSGGGTNTITRANGGRGGGGGGGASAAGSSFRLPLSEADAASSSEQSPQLTCLHTASRAWEAALILPKRSLPRDKREDVTDRSGQLIVGWQHMGDANTAMPSGSTSTTAPRRPRQLARRVRKLE